MDKKTRLVIAHVNYIHLDNVKFVVSAKGVARIRREKRKKVVAFVEGDYNPIGLVQGHEKQGWSQAYFNPYKVDTFMVGYEPIHEADKVYIVGRSIHVKEISHVA